VVACRGVVEVRGVVESRAFRRGAPHKKEVFVLFNVEHHTRNKCFSCSMQSVGRVKEVEASLAAARAEKLEAVVSAVHTQTGGGDMTCGDMTSTETSSASTWRKLEEREAQLDGALVALKEVDTLQHTVMHCSTLQHTATYCNMLQDAAA